MKKNMLLGSMAFDLVCYVRTGEVAWHSHGVGWLCWDGLNNALGLPEDKSHKLSLIRVLVHPESYRPRQRTKGHPIVSTRKMTFKRIGNLYWEASRRGDRTAATPYPCTEFLDRIYRVVKHKPPTDGCMMTVRLTTEDMATWRFAPNVYRREQGKKG